MTGAGAGSSGTAGGVSLSGTAALRSWEDDGKGGVCAGPSLSGLTRGAGAGGVARRSGGGGRFFITFFAKTVGAGDAGAWAGLGENARRGDLWGAGKEHLGVALLRTLSLFGVVIGSVRFVRLVQDSSHHMRLLFNRKRRIWLALRSSTKRV